MSAVEQALIFKRKRKPPSPPAGNRDLGVKRAVVSKPIIAIGKKVLGIPLVRQGLKKVPFLKKFIPGSPERAAKMDQQLGLLSTGKPVGSQAGSIKAIAIPIAKKVATIGAIGGTFAVGEQIVQRTLEATVFREGPTLTVPQFNLQQQRRPAQMARNQALQVGQALPPSHNVVRTWQTFPGGPVFARLADGHIAVQKKDGTIKHFRPYRPVVIPKKWSASSMRRVATALKRQRKTATKIMQITGGMPKSRR